MSPVIQFSSRDLLRGKILEPAWYLMRIESVGENPSRDGGSINFPVEGTVIKNADNGDEAFAGTPITWNFNSKALGFATGFMNALGVVIEADKRYDLGGAAGKEIEVFVENGEYEGRTVNRVNHKYRPVSVKEVV